MGTVSFRTLNKITVAARVKVKFLSHNFIDDAMKLIILTILLPCVFGQNCPQLPENDGCEPPHLRCDLPPGPDGCPVAPLCVWVNPFDRCSARPVCPNICDEGEMYCSGPIDADGCPGAEVCHPTDPAQFPDQCYSTMNCPVFCGPGQETCHGEVDPNDPNQCRMPDTCIDVDPTAVCKNTCPPPPC